MEVISIDGIEYVRAAAIARKYKYTSDYIGQLCRSGKVAAKLVGRTWYVSPDSLEQHQQGRYQKNSTDEKTNKNKSHSKSSRIDVEAVPRTDTVKSIANARQHSPQFLRRIEWKPVKYEADQSDLLPPLRQEAVSIKVPVDVAEAETLSITESSSPVNLEAEPLPEVSLRGAIKIRNAEDNFSDEDNSLENIDISLGHEDESLHIHPVSKDRKTTIKIVPDEPEIAEEVEESNQPKEKVNEEPYTYDVPVTVNDRASFTPRSVAKKVTAPDLEIVRTESRKSTRTQTFILVSIVLAALVVCGLVFSLERVLVANTTNQSSLWNFSLPNIPFDS